MIINIHAGHNPDGKVACGAVGFIKESTEARRVKNILIDKLKEKGHIVYDCTVDNGISQNDVLKKIIKKTNAVKADLDISIHFNALSTTAAANKKTTGTEVYIKSNSKAKVYAQSVVDNIANLGYKNRGVKTSTSLYYLNKCSNPAMLIECCFVNDPDDVAIYNPNTMAAAIAKSLPANEKAMKDYFYNGIDYSPVFNPEYYARKNPDVAQAFGTDTKMLFFHFTQCGMKEGREAISSFNVNIYKHCNSDLQQVFKEDLPMYYWHYCKFGRLEPRKAI